MNEEVDKEALLLKLPAGLKDQVKRAVKASEYRSMTHLIETLLRDFLVRQQRQAEKTVAQ